MALVVAFVMAAEGQGGAGPLKVVIGLAAALVGFVAGTATGGALLVPPGSGLAGPAIALGWGVVGAAWHGGRFRARRDYRVVTGEP